MFLLTSKPIIYIANISEEQINNADNEEMVKKVKEYANKEGELLKNVLALSPK